MRSHVPSLLHRLSEGAWVAPLLCAWLAWPALAQEARSPEATYPGAKSPQTQAPPPESSAPPRTAAPRPAAPPAPAVTVAAGQSAVDLALDRAPAGVSVEQFLVALYRLNPQAFSEGRIDRLTAGASLQLPTAAQAQVIGPQQARAQLQALRQAASASSAAPDAPPTPGAASPAPGTAPAEGASPPADTNPAGPSGVAGAGPGGASPAAVAPAASALAIDPLMLIGVGAAVLTLLWLAFKPAEPPRPSRARREPAGAADRPANTWVKEGPTPAFKSLSDFGPLPSLDLNDSAEPAASPAAAPRPAAFDLSRISLDLGPEDKRPS